VDGHRLALTNLDKVLYPATGTTKGEVIAYYTAVAPVLLPHLRQRPITRKRYPDGVGGEAPNVFFAKNLPAGTPDWVRRYPIKHRDGSHDYPVADDAATLTWLAQLAALELHVPQWRFAADGTALPPDRLVFDLDPGEGVGLAQCAEVAHWVRELLDGAGLTAFGVTSGSKGIHLYAHLDGSLDAEGASEVAKQVAQTLQASHPERVTAVMRRADRAGKVFLDWSQNNGNKTTVSPYSLRGRERPWVAAPRTWDELGSTTLRQLEFSEMVARLAELGDLLAPLLAADGPDRLAAYRGLRDAAKTPEPVPAAAPAASAGRSFVIQEHHARRLHYDFRLEREGVLVSWAVPKGPPSDPRTNHLAVHVEDHPLAYGGFEGTIPKGEYGAGSVRIWDAGVYELEKWREGKEVIITLHGRPDGGLGGEPAKFALIHTGANDWLIHRMQSSLSPSKGPLSPPSSSLSPSKGPLSPPSSSLSPSKGSLSPPSSSLSPSKGSLSPAKGKPIAPMLAVSASPTSVPQESQWAFEMKWDGVRAIVTIADGAVTLTSRNGREETLRYPDLLPDLAGLGCASATLDGEIVVLDANGAPDFGLLQPRINLTGQANIAAAAKLAPAQLMLFDLLELDGTAQLGLAYEQRRELLEQLVPAELGRLHVPPVFDGDLAAALDASSAFGLEGVVAKRLGSTYLPGRRSEAWLKIKHRRSQSVVIGGWWPGEGNRDGRVGSLLVGVPDGDQLRYLGRVGSGFSDAGLIEAEALLAPLSAEVSPFAEVPAADAKGVHWTRPVLVGEVQFSGLSASRRLRHPVWLGWRPELKPADVHDE